MPIRAALRFSLLLVALTWSVNAWSQNQAGEAGTLLGKELLDNARAPVYDADGGRDGMGRFELGGVVVDGAEIAPGATRNDIEQLTRKKDSELSSLEQEGIDQFDHSAQQEGAQGEATRALASAQIITREQALGDDPELVERMRSSLTGNPLGQAFADCDSTTTVQDGGSLSTVHSQDYTCTIGSVGSSCSRSREVLVEPNEDRYEEGGRGDLWKVYDRIAFNGQCEAETVDGECRQEWVCTDSAPRTIGMLHIDEAEAIKRGLEPLFPGAPALCWEAKLKATCPVCIEDEFGNKRDCKYVDIAQPEGNTCGALESNNACRVIGEGCLVTDGQGGCAVTSKRYSCDKQVSVPVTDVRTTNTCAGSIQCLDGSCNAGVDFNEDSGTAMQVAMAQMVVADAMATDVTRNADTARESRGPAPIDDQPVANDPNNAARNWGYDQDDTGGAEAEPEVQLTAAEQEMIAEAQIFRGNPYRCQKGYGGLVDCCKATDSNAQELFWKIYSEVNRSKQAARLADDDTVSGYRQMQSGTGNMSTLSSPFTSMRDNVMGGGTGEVDNSSLTVWQIFMARAREEIKPSLSPSWACSDGEFDLAVQREIGSCSYAGTYCSKKVLGTCLKKREAYCCYKSPMSKTLRASAEPGGVIPHGNPKQPDCGGIPLDEMDRINWDSIDFTRMAGHMSEGGMFEKANDPANASRNMTGAGATVMSEGRKNVEDRTIERIDSIDVDSVYSGIEADAAARAHRPDIAVQAGAPVLSFAAPYMAIPAGQPRAIGIARTGSRGSAAATVRVVEGSVDEAGFYQAQVEWGDGETGVRNFRVDPPAGATGRVVLELTPAAGAGGGNTIMTLDIQ